MQSTVVPFDFPRNPFPASLSGCQPKVAARFIDGRYVVGLTDAELEGRYICCADLVEQLSIYVQVTRWLSYCLKLALGFGVKIGNWDRQNTVGS
jgi:hypothetical protein